MNWKHPITLIVVAAVVIGVLYYLISPYQNCSRDSKETGTWTSGGQHMCTENTSW
jgi:hypothetical protein